MIGLKGNQPALLEDVSLYFKDFGTTLPSFTTKEKDNGRVEKLPFVDGCILAAGTDAMGGAESSWFRLLHCDQKWCNQHRYPLFITSLSDIDRFSYAVHKYWPVENQLHWALDVIFEEDSSRARKDMSPLNLNVLRKTAGPLQALRLRS